MLRRKCSKLPGVIQINYGLSRSWKEGRSAGPRLSNGRVAGHTWGGAIIYAYFEPSCCSSNRQLFPKVIAVCIKEYTQTFVYILKHFLLKWHLECYWLPPVRVGKLRYSSKRSFGLNLCLPVGLVSLRKFSMVSLSLIPTFLVNNRNKYIQQLTESPIGQLVKALPVRKVIWEF